MSKFFSIALAQMSPAIIFRIVVSLATLLITHASGFAVSMTLVAPHPTSPLTGYPNIHSIKSYNGRVYFGYGDYNYYPVNVIASYSASENVVRLEHSAGTDAVDTMRILGGKLFTPSVDPIHYEDFRDFSYYTPGLGWRDMAPAGALHVYDCAELGTDLFICGARDVAEGVGSGGSVLMRSSDGGRSWVVVPNSTGGTRFYWCFTLGSRVWTQGGYFQGSAFFFSSLLNVTYFYKPTTLPGGFAVALSGRAPTSSGAAGTLVSFDGSAVRTLAANVLDFTWDGTDLYIVSMDGSISRATNLTAAGATWLPTAVSAPNGTRALEVLDGIAYVATGSLIYAARLSGAVWGLGAPSVVNEMPDSFGRGLAFDGDRLIVGAPDSSTNAVPLRGRVSVWTAPASTLGSWQLTRTLDPPVADFSGWFGKDVATRGDLMAVVESGYDVSNIDRGSSARVHVYQLVSGFWTARTILSVPFAHSAVFDENMLMVGTGNPAANQAAGLPGVNPYLITRDASNVPSFTAQAQLVPQNAAYGYKPIARVARIQDRLVAGWAGDPSRTGGQGLVSVWKKNAAGTGWSSAPVQEFTATGVNRYDRFGFAVAGDGIVLAVGAPRDDAVAPQAGRVYLYSWNGTRYNQTQIINSPLLQAEAGFGSALAMKGNYLLIGAPGATIGTTPHAGAVYLYVNNGGSWQFVRTLQRPASSLAEFGVEVAIGETWLAAGSRFSSASAEITSRVAFELIYPISDWSAANGLTGASASPFADLDLDGLVNLLEYACGTNPNVSDLGFFQPGKTSGLPLVLADTTSADGSLLVTYLRPVSDASLFATIEAGASPDILLPVVAEPVSTVNEGGMVITTVRVRPPAGATQFFVRVRYGYF